MEERELADDICTYARLVAQWRAAHPDVSDRYLDELVGFISKKTTAAVAAGATRLAADIATQSHESAKKIVVALGQENWPAIRRNLQQRGTALDVILSLLTVSEVPEPKKNSAWGHVHERPDFASMAREILNAIGGNSDCTGAAVSIAATLLRGADARTFEC